MKNLQNLEEYYIQTYNCMKELRKYSIFVFKPNNQRRGIRGSTSSNRPAGKLEGKLKREKINIFKEGEAVSTTKTALETFF